MSETKNHCTEEEYEDALDTLLDSVYDYIDARDALENYRANDPNNLPGISSLINEVDIILNDVYNNGKAFRELDKIQGEDDQDDVEDTDD